MREPYPVYAWKMPVDTPFMRKSLPRLCVERNANPQLFAASRTGEIAAKRLCQLGLIVDGRADPIPDSSRRAVLVVA